MKLLLYNCLYVLHRSVRQTAHFNNSNTEWGNKLFLLWVPRSPGPGPAMWLLSPNLIWYDMIWWGKNFIILHHTTPHDAIHHLCVRSFGRFQASGTVLYHCLLRQNMFFHTQRNRKIKGKYDHFHRFTFIFISKNQIQFVVIRFILSNIRFFCKKKLKKRSI